MRERERRNVHVHETCFVSLCVSLIKRAYARVCVYLVSVEHTHTHTCVHILSLKRVNGG